MLETNQKPDPMEEASIPEHDTIFEETEDADKGVLAEIDFNLRQTGRWLLKVVGGPNNGAEFAMQPGHTYTVGTDPTSCDVVFHDNSVSRQHARIAISDRNTLTLEDLKSRNGTLLDGAPVAGQVPLEPNTLISLGTSSFVVFDRDGDMQTIISPLLPSIVKVLQRESEEKFKEGKQAAVPAAADAAGQPAAPPAAPETKQTPTTALVLIGIVSALFLLVGAGTVTLFQSEPIELRKPIDFNMELEKALAPFPSVRFTYTPSTGQLFLQGHVLTRSDKNQLIYNLQGLEFPWTLDESGLVIDEGVWRETNSILNRDPRWRGISVHSPAAGTFVLSGYLQTRKQAEELNDYITANFPYLDLLERRVIVEEDLLNSVDIQLQNAGIKSLKSQLNNGILTLTGGLSREQMVALERLNRKFKEIPGIQSVKTFINELEPEQTMINLSQDYKVTGSSNQGGSNMTVVINGRILSRGDTLDGMTITSIRPNVIFLEKDGAKYRIDYLQ